MALLLGAGCSDPLFKPQEYCEVDCPLPPTQPPNVTWIAPAPGATVGPATTLLVQATDDLRIDHVEFFYSFNWIKLHPGVVGAAPWQAVLGKYVTGFPNCTGPIAVQAVAWDIEGKSDTAYTTLNWVPPPGTICGG